ncbi:MAG: tetratricopeptide repeat protein [Verrucomicrobiota bacterium]
MTNARSRRMHLVGLLCLLLAVSSQGADSPTNSEDSVRALLQMQEQIHEAQLAIERNRTQADEASARNAKAISDRLQFLEQSLSAQRSAELDAVQRSSEQMQRSNRNMLIAVGALAVIGCMAALLTTYFQWRTVNRLMTISSALPMMRGLGGVPSMGALGMGDELLPSLPAAGPQPGAELLAAMERLSKRIQELERSAQPSLGASNILDLPGSDAAAGTGGAASGKTPVTALLAKGQVALNEGKPEESVVCFDEVLAADPQNTEALVKKGAALERLRRPQEALDCYDRALAVDGGMTIAWLYKGGLFNRLERFSEALACYEKALHSQEKRRAS